MPSRFDPGLLPQVPDLAFESSLWQAGCQIVAGVDEAGRGAMAGPVAAAAVILPRDPLLPSLLAGVRDSKQMTPAEREESRTRIQFVARSWAVGMASHLEIDRYGLVPATHLAALRALAGLSIQPDHLLLDYLFLEDFPASQTSLIKGDCRSLSIAAASVLAKTARDAWMCELDRQFPGYGFAEHKGYCTPVHKAMLRRLGLTPFHRRSFRPVWEIDGNDCDRGSPRAIFPLDNDAPQEI
jgi:ribonuclease HII